MALFKIEKGLKANLANNRPNTTEGFCYFTTDDGKFYIDTATAIGTSNRVLLNAGAADKLTVNAGAANKPIYFKDGVPTEGSYELNKTVPSDAKFTDTNTKVTQTVTTSNAAYPLLLAPSGQTATTTTTSYFDSGVTLNPSTNTIAANISGDAATATQLYTTQKNPSSGITYCLPFISSATSGNKDYYANDGIGYWTHEGTTSAVGAGELKLGNSIASGTAGNKRGMIYMYGTSNGYTEIMPSNNTGSNVVVYLPSKGGTIALDTVFGASGSTAAKGLVPAPSTTAGTTKYLREDGKWVQPPDNNTTYSAGTGLTLDGSTFKVSTVPIANGGTGATTAAAAANNLLSRGTSNGDFNTKTDTGVMWTQLPSCTNTPHGDNPTGRYGYLEVIKAVNGSSLQRWTNYINGDTWVRSQDAGTSGNLNDWRAWSRYLDSNNYSSYALPLSGGTMTGLLKFAAGNAMPNFNSPSVVATYVNNDSAQGLGYAHTSTLSVGYANNADTVDGYHATSFGINYNVGDANLNTCTQSGFYRLGGTITNGFSNASWGQMLVVHGCGDTICQVGLPYNEGALYIRQGNPSDVGGNGPWREWKRLWGAGDAVTGAVWNDYAECRESSCDEPGYVLYEKGDDTLEKTTERLSAFAGVSSDTWGFSQGETEKAKTHIAVAGRVLVYPYRNRNEYKPGDCVCAAPGGTVDIMTREEVINWPDRIVGTVSCVPKYEEWGGGEGADRAPVKVNGRIWIKVK